MRLSEVRFLIIIFIIGVITNMCSAETFQPKGRCAWDPWLAEEAGVYHLFFLEAPKYLGEHIHGNTIVGHATSKDLLNWNYEGPVLANAKQSWNNESIATGSVAKYGDKWYMLFSGWSTGQSGLGLAVSEDLYLWEKKEDGPVVKVDQVFESDYKCKTYKWIAHRDPYIYPEQIDGWYYAVACSRIQDMPIEKSGALAMLRSRDMVSWEPYKIVAFPGYLEWMETPQLWKHKDKWYMYFGAVRNDDLLKHNRELIPEKLQYSRLSNCYFVSDNFDGPFEPLDNGEYLLNAPLEQGQWCYIFKFLNDANGRNVAITNINYYISNPFIVDYAKDGSIKLSKYAK